MKFTIDGKDVKELNYSDIERKKFTTSLNIEYLNEYYKVLQEKLGSVGYFFAFCNTSLIILSQDLSLMILRPYES